MKYLKIDIYCEQYARKITNYVYYIKDENNNFIFFPNGCEEENGSSLCTECKNKSAKLAKDLIFNDPDTLRFY